MRVLVVYASRYGATQEIAERIAATLRKQNLDATVQSAKHADDPVGYDAAVIGSAAYYFHWMKPATEFLRRNRDTLTSRPVWLFSSGPLGTEATDAQGRDVRAATEPKEIAEVRETIRPREHLVFFGALEPSKLGFAHRLLMRLPANSSNALFPVGDFRDWSDVEAWANRIAQALKASADDTQCHADLPELSIVR